MSSLGSACQHGVIRHHIELVCSQDKECSCEIGQELLFNKIQWKHCIEMHLRNRTVRMVSVVKAVHFICLRIRYFAPTGVQRWDRAQVIYAIRSEQTILYQSFVSPDSTLDILPWRFTVRLSVANTFLRLLQNNTRPRRIRGFRVPRLVPSIHLEISSNIFGVTKEQAYRLCVPQGTMHRKDSANVKTEWYAVVAPGKLLTPASAAKHSANQVRSEDSNRLPLKTGSIEMHSKGSHVVVDSFEEITLLMRSNILTNVSDLAVNAYVSELSGCYECLYGARAKVSCVSHYNTVAEIQCNNFTTVKLSLRGQLFNYPILNDSVFFLNSEEARINLLDFSQFHLPDFKPLLGTIKSHWKMALCIADTILQLPVLSTYLDQ
ncbi:hypothetical protein COOONC_02201 [Cooperia oncophora]